MKTNTRLVSCVSFLGLLLLFVSILLYNFYAIPAHDELSYAFQGQSTSMYGDVDRVSSLQDIISQQSHDYTKPGGNGRVIVHGIVAFFAGFKLYYLFDILNTCVWFLLTWLILKAANIKIKNWGSCLWYATIVWMFLWYGESCLNAAFAVNYLWTACATVAMLLSWGTPSCWWLIPLGFLYGWSQEVFVLPLLATLAAVALIKTIQRKKIVISYAHFFTWIAIASGAYFLCCGPASLSRVNSSVALPVSALILKIVKAQIGFLILLWPIILFLVLAIILWKNRKELSAFFFRNLVWILFFLFSYASFILTSTNGVVRLSMPILLAGVILVLREGHILTLPKRLPVIFVGFALCWCFVGAILQIQAGGNTNEMLSIYQKSTQGITYRKQTCAGFHDYTVQQGIYNRWHRALWRLEYNKKVSPAIFTPWLYNALYRHSEDFLGSAYNLSDSTFYVNPRCPLVVVARGDVIPTLDQFKVLMDYFVSYELNVSPKGWKRLIPGRFKTMFPDENSVLGLPSDRFVFINQCGEVFTIFIRDKPNVLPAWN